MSKYIVEYSRDSRQDLIDIKRYIKYNLYEPDIANKLIAKIRNGINKLIDNPEIYPIKDDEFLKKLEIRKLIIDNYIIFYRIKSYNIEIVRIMYCKRNWMELI